MKEREAGSLETRQGETKGERERGRVEVVNETQMWYKIREHGVGEHDGEL